MRHVELTVEATKHLIEVLEDVAVCAETYDRSYEPVIFSDAEQARAEAEKLRAKLELVNLEAEPAIDEEGGSVL